MRPLQGLICDFDGALVDGTLDVRHAMNAVMKAHGRRDLELSEVRKAVGQGAMAMIERAFLVTGGLPQDDLYPFVKEFIGALRVINPDPAQVYPHVRDILAECQKAGVRIGICTNKPEEATKHLLQSLKMDQYFFFVAGGDTFPYHKPNPDHINGVIKALGVSKEGCVMVGDSTNDVAAAKGAGIPCIIVTHGFDSDPEPIHADATIESFSTLPQALEKLGFDLP